MTQSGADEIKKSSSFSTYILTIKTERNGAEQESKTQQQQNTNSQNLYNLIRLKFAKFMKAGGRKCIKWCVVVVIFVVSNSLQLLNWFVAEFCNNVVVGIAVSD